MNFFLVGLDRVKEVIGRPYYDPTNNDELLGEIIGRRKSQAKRLRSEIRDTWDLLIRKPDGEVVQVSTGALLIPIKEVTLPDEPTPEETSREEARRLYREGLQDDIERQRRGEAAKEGYELPPDQQGPQTPSELDREPGPTFRWFSDPEPPPEGTPEEGQREDSIFPAAAPSTPEPKEPNPADPGWVEYMLGKRPFIGPQPIQDPALIGVPKEGGSTMASPLEQVKARLAGSAEELNGVRQFFFRDSDGVSQMNLRLAGERTKAIDRISMLNNHMEMLERERGAIIRATQGHQVASPTRVLFQVDAAIQSTREAIAIIRAAIVDMGNAQSRLAVADDTVKNASTQTAGAIAELDSYRTSF